MSSPIASKFGLVRGALSAIILVAMPVVALWLWFKPHTTPAEVVIDGRIRVRVEVADTMLAQERGLSGHAPLAADEGMVFLFDRPEKYAFWMKDMTFPIDIIWIMDGAIADITPDVPVPTPGVSLPTFAPKVPVDTVLEVNAGFARQHGLRIGLPVQVRKGP